MDSRNGIMERRPSRRRLSRRQVVQVVEGRPSLRSVETTRLSLGVDEEE